MINIASKKSSFGHLPSEIDQTTEPVDAREVPVNLGAGLGKRLRQAMRARDLNDRELSEATHDLVSRSAINALKHGQGDNAGINTLTILAKALKVRVAWLAFDDGDMDLPS